MDPPRPRRLGYPTNIENLPGELLSEILIRVPSKSLAQMRSVSKPWNHLLSQPSFIKSHLHRSIENNDEILLVLLSGDSHRLWLSVTAHLSRSPHLELPDFIKFPDTTPPPDHSTVTFFGSVNGLICYAFRTDSNDYVIQIWNPSLSAVLTLPPFNGLDWFLIDDTTHELHFWFGYDPKTDDYKLVKLMSYTLPLDPINYLPGSPDVIQAKWHFSNLGNDVKEVEVYSMRNGSWKLIENRLPSHVTFISDEDVVCADGYDGRLHWIGIVNGNKQTIVTFDLGVECFGEICLPNSVIERYWNGLGFYSGKLCVMSFKKGYEHEVWVMKEYGVAESWTKIRIFSDFGDDIDPHGFTASNKFLFSTNSDSDSDYTFDQLNIYDPDADEVKSFETDARDSVWTKVVRYVDSLVWVAPTTKQIQPGAEISQIER